MKKTHSNKRCNYFHQHSENEKKLYQFTDIVVITIFERQVPEVYASRKSQVFFLVFAGHKHISLFGRATIDRFFNYVH